MAVGAVGTGLASSLPWGASASRTRNSYELVAVAGRLDLPADALVRPSRAWCSGVFDELPVHADEEQWADAERAFDDCLAG